MKNEITSKEYWQQTEVLNNQTHEIPLAFKKVFGKFLKVNQNPDAVALEIGCAPGAFLAHICKNFKYKPEGVDYVRGAAQITNETLLNEGLNEAKIYEEDFFKWQPEKKYNLVSSFGFIEHFNDVDVVIEKHVSLLQNGGTLILEVPNFTHGQNILHKWLDKENLSRHNTTSMHIKFFKEIAKQYNLKIKYLGHVGGAFDFWWENQNPTTFQKLFRFCLKPIALVGKKIPLNNRLFSPFLIFIAEKQS